MPIGIKFLALFFAFGACMCVLTIVLLLFPGTAMDGIWRLNPAAHAGFHSMGTLAVLLMLVVGIACGLAAIGLATGAGWGRPLAIVILSVNLVGDLSSAVFRHDLRTLIGLPIGGAMIIYLVQSRRAERRYTEN